MTTSNCKGAWEIIHLGPAEGKGHFISLFHRALDIEQKQSTAWILVSNKPHIHSGNSTGPVTLDELCSVPLVVVYS